MMSAMSLITISVHLLVIPLANSCSWVDMSPTDVCQPSFNYETSENYAYQVTCKNGYPFEQHWSGSEVNNCHGPPTNEYNVTSTAQYNCDDYPSSCDYFVELDYFFNGTELNQCTDQYLTGYANFAFAIDVCLGKYSWSCNNDNATMTTYKTEDCRDVISKSINPSFKCKSNGYHDYNQTLTFCSSANV